MTRVTIIDGCLGREGCDQPGGARLLCPDHAPIFDGPVAVNITINREPTPNNIVAELNAAKVAFQARTIAMHIKGEIVP